MYIKEGTTNYLKLQQNYILKVYNITFSSYSNVTNSEGRATIIGVDSDSVHISYVVSTSFNILSTTVLNLQSALDQNDELSESDKLLVTTEAAVIVCLSSDFYMHDIDVYSEYNDVNDFNYFFRFIQPLYKNIRIAHADIGVSGMILYADQQVEASLEHLSLDFYRAQAGVFFDMTWSDTSVIFNSTLNVNNVTLYFSQDRINIRYVWNPIRYFGAGKINYYNMTVRMFTDHVYNRVIAYNFLDDSWVLESDDFPVINVTNAYFTIPEQEDKNLADVYAPFIVHSFGDRAVNGTELHFTNVTFYNMGLYNFRTMSLEIGPYSDIYAKDLTFENMYMTQQTFYITSARNAYFENLSMINCTLDGTELFYSEAYNLTINNLNIEGVYGSDESGVNSVGDIRFQTIANFQDLHIDTLSVSNFESFFKFSSGGSGNVTLNNVTFNNANILTPLITMTSVAQIEISEIFFIQIDKQTSNDVSNTMIDLTSVSSSINRNITISGINVENSSMSLLKLSNAAQTTSINQYISISELSYKDCIYEYNDDLIYFGNIVSDQTYTLTLNQISISNISFSRSGNLFNFQHQTTDAIVISNMNISNVVYGSIFIKSFDLSGNNGNTKVAFYKMNAQNIDGQFESLISLEEGAEIEIIESTFSFISNVIGGSVLHAGYKNAIAEIYDSVFSNNTSTEGGVFLTQSESVIRLYNCTWTNNFAVGSGVIKAESNGYYEIYNSHINNNYGLYAAVSEIFSTNIQSVINNSTIINNIALTSEYIQNEFLIQGKYNANDFP